MTTQPNRVLSGGPYLQAAVLCEQVIEGKDNVLTIVRVIDQITRRVRGREAPTQMEPFDHPITLVIMLKAGQARGRHELLVNITDSEKNTRKGPVQEIYLEGEEDQGKNWVARMVVHFTVPGLHWFDVYFDDAIIAKMPLRVTYVREQAG